MRALSKKFAAVLTVALTFFVVAFSSQAASATQQSWPANDLFTVGNAIWQFNEYGVQYGYTVDGSYDSDGYVYYPNEFAYDSASQYFYCGDSNTYQTDSIVTVLNSGTINILCPLTSLAGYPTLEYQLSFLIYPETDSGFLVRQQLSIHNDSDNYVAIPDLTLVNYPNLFEQDLNVINDGYARGQYLCCYQENWFADSTVNSAVRSDPQAVGQGQLWPEATYFSQGMTDGTAVSMTSAWAQAGSAPYWHYVTDSLSYNDPYRGRGTELRTAAPNYFAANSTTNLLTFTNMVIPDAVDAASGAAAKQIALEQTEEFASFDGRLIEGLSECTTFVGWGTTPGTCDMGGSSSGSGSGSSTPQPCIAALAETGINFFISLTGGLAAAGVGMWLLYKSRRNNRINRGRVRGMLFPDA